MRVNEDGNVGEVVVEVLEVREIYERLAAFGNSWMVASVRIIAYVVNDVEIRDELVEMSCPGDIIFPQTSNN